MKTLAQKARDGKLQPHEFQVSIYIYIYINLYNYYINDYIFLGWNLVNIQFRNVWYKAIFCSYKSSTI